MPPPRKSLMKDSIAANPRAKRTLALLVATGAVKKGQKAYIWYGHPEYADSFCESAPGKISKTVCETGARQVWRNQQNGKLASASSVVPKATDLLGEEEEGNDDVIEDEDDGDFDAKELRAGRCLARS
eukprot:IDg1357t1